MIVVVKELVRMMVMVVVRSGRDDSGGDRVVGEDGNGSSNEWYV